MNNRGRKYRFAIFIAFIFQIGCSSTCNLNTEDCLWHGGFADQEMLPGLYRLTSNAIMTPWPSFGAAKSTWKARAEQLCGKNAYQEIVTEKDPGLHGSIDVVVGQSYLPVPEYNTRISGYILCNSSNMSREEAIKYLNDLPVAQAKEEELRLDKELEELGGEDCDKEGINADAENFYQRGKILMNLNNYKPAMTCLVRAQEIAKDKNIFADSCSSIGMMYELGWGVEKNTSIANEWYRKAGLKN